MFSVKQLKINKFIKYIWKLIISTSNATLEVSSLHSCDKSVSFPPFIAIQSSLSLKTLSNLGAIMCWKSFACFIFLVLRAWDRFNCVRLFERGLNSPRSNNYLLIFLDII